MSNQLMKGNYCLGKRCLLFVCNKDALFRQIVSNLLVNVDDHVEIFESTARNLNDLLQDVSDINPDIILLEETSPLSVDSLLVHVLFAKPGRPVIVISQEHNWMHMVRWETIQLHSANDLISTIALV